MYCISFTQALGLMMASFVITIIALMMGLSGGSQAREGPLDVLAVIALFAAPTVFLAVPIYYAAGFVVECKK